MYKVVFSPWLELRLKVELVICLDLLTLQPGAM